MLMRHIYELRPNSLALQCCGAEARAAWRRAFCLKPEPDFPNIDFFWLFFNDLEADDEKILRGEPPAGSGGVPKARS